MKEEVPFEVIKLIVQRIQDGKPLDSSSDYQIYLVYKEIIHLHKMGSRELTTQPKTFFSSKS